MDIGSSPSGSSRRAFLAGAAGLAGAMLLGGDAVFTASGLELLAAAEPAASVGYVDGSAGRSAATAMGGGGRVVPATSLRAGALNGRTVRVRVAGLTPGVGADIEHVVADLHLPSAADRRTTVPFFAFTHRRDAGGSAPSRTMLAAASGLRAGVRVQVADAVAGASSRVAVFSSSERRGFSSLVPGVYLVALGGGVWDSARALPATDGAWAGAASVILEVAEA